MNACQKESKLLLCLFRCESKYFKHLALDLLVEDTDTSASDLVTIQNDVVCFCTDSSRITVDVLKVFFHRHCKRMMHCCETVLFITPLKKREFCDPQEFVFILIKEFHLACQFQTECTKNIPYNFILICRKEKKVSVLSSPSLRSALLSSLFRHKF